MKEQIIFYGVGQHTQVNYHQLIAKGLSPLCFVDDDAHKQNTKLFGHDILSLEEALRRYPDSEFYLTIDKHNLRVGNKNLLEVFENLIKIGIPEERIKFVNPMEQRKGCVILEGQPHISSNNIWICCAVPDEDKMQSIQYDNLKDGLESYYNAVSAIVKRIKSSQSTMCDDCVYLQEDFWSITPRVNCFIFEGDFKGDFCNFKCCYCGKAALYEEGYRKEGRDFLDTLRQIGELFDKGEISLNLANGEITSRPDCDEILEFVQSKQWPVILTTNASIYKEKVADLICAGLMYFMIVSLDAGTSETFHKVKGVDCFDIVAENLRQYSALGADIKLKYILLEGLNDNDEDIDNFVEIVANLNATCRLSANIYTRRNRLSKYALDAAISMINKCKERNLRMECLYENFHILDRKTLKMAFDR